MDVPLTLPLPCVPSFAVCLIGTSQVEMNSRLSLQGKSPGWMSTVDSGA